MAGSEEADGVSWLGVSAGFHGFEGNRSQTAAGEQMEDCGGDGGLADARVRTDDDNSGSGGGGEGSAVGRGRRGRTKRGKGEEGSWGVIGQGGAQGRERGKRRRLLSARADRVILSREVPSRTVGGRMAGTKKPVGAEVFGGFEGDVVGSKDDGKDGGWDGIGGKAEEGAELSDVRMKVGAQLIALRGGGDFQCCPSSSGDRERDGSCEEEGTGTIDEVGAENGVAGNEGAAASEGLAEGSDEHVGADAEVGAEASPLGAEGSQGHGLRRQGGRLRARPRWQRARGAAERRRPC